MKALELASLLGYQYAGNNDIEVSSIRFADDAKENDIAICKTYNEILKTKALVVLSKATISLGKNFIYTYEDLNLTAIKIANVFISKNLLPDYNMTPIYIMKGHSMYGKNIEIGNNTYIGCFCFIGDNVIIGKNCHIENNVYIGDGTVIEDNVIVRSGARIGANCNFYYFQNEIRKIFPGVGKTHIFENVEVGYNTVVQRGTFKDTVIGSDTKIGNLVEVAHDVNIGSNCRITSQVGIAGNVTIGKNVIVYGQVGIADNTNIGDNAVIMAKSGVTKNVKPGEVVSGMPARKHCKELELQAKIRSIRKV